jgi:hypothetical protein
MASGLFSVCKALDQMIDASTPPDLVLDFTIGGPNSEVVQIQNLLILVKLEIKYITKIDVSSTVVICHF